MIDPFFKQMPEELGLNKRSLKFVYRVRGFSQVLPYSLVEWEYGEPGGEKVTGTILYRDRTIVIASGGSLLSQVRQKKEFTDETEWRSRPIRDRIALGTQEFAVPESVILALYDLKNLRRF